MGLFGPKKKTEVVDPSTGEVVELKETINCCVCGGSLGVFNKNKITRDFYICDDCAEKSAVMRHKKDVENYSDEALKELIKKKIDKAATFKLTNNTESYLFVDRESKQLTVPYMSGLTKSKANVDPDDLIPFDAVQGYSLSRDGQVISEGGRANKPADMGVFSYYLEMPGKCEDIKGCSEILVRIKTNLSDRPEILVYLLDKKVSVSSDAYKIAMYNAEEVINMIMWICKD